MKVTFQMALEDRVFKELRALAYVSGVGLQELIRARIIPEWMEKNGFGFEKEESDKIGPD